MSGAINPEAAQSSSTQGFEQSDRNPQVTTLGGTDADGGQIPAPSPSESRVTQSGPATSDAGATNHDSEDGAGFENEAEREG